MIPAPPPKSIEVPLAHVLSSFEFTIKASLREAAPLFGPEGERKWAGKEWDPQFIHPRPPKDIEGAIFLIDHAGMSSVWVNTLFDVAHGRMQYVATLPNVMVTVIDVRLHAKGAATLVSVSYARTALKAEFSDQVLTIGRADANRSTEWEHQIREALGKH